MSNTQQSNINIQQNEQKQKPIQQIDFEKEFSKWPNVIYPDNQFKIIHQIDINQKHTLIASKAGLWIYNMKQNIPNNKKIIIEGDIWDAAFIPKTHYVAYCLNKKSQKQNLYIWNLKQQKLAARIKIQDEIQQIRPTKNCIALASMNQIYIIHFPSLKPIYNGVGGNNVNILFDLSYQGLTMAHNSCQRGELIIRNFTNIRKSQAITQRKKSIFSSRVKLVHRKQSDDTVYTGGINEEEQIQPVIKVNAHIDMLSKIKVSPNGSKVVTASLKGTVLRIFSAKNGNKLQQFRVGYQLVKIVDICFVQDGNILGCMNFKGSIYLYNVSMDKQEKQYEIQRKGHKIYTQNNPKSFFSFLSFVYPPLNDSFSFNHYQLINPEFKQQSSKELKNETNMNTSFSKSQSIIEDEKSENIQKNHHNQSIQELEEEHLQDLSSQRKQQNSYSFNQQSLISGDTFKKNQPQNSYSINNLTDLKPLRRSLKINSSPGNHRNSTPNRTNSLITDSKLSSREKLSRTISKSKTMQKRRSSVSRQKQKQKKEQVFQRPFNNMNSKLYITQANYIWAVKGYHIFGLKYDAFHGGQMVLDRTLKIQ